jgi:hypothetical protein
MDGTGKTGELWWRFRHSIDPKISFGRHYCTVAPIATAYETA